MSVTEETYLAFMMDHAAGVHSPALSLAANLHTLLSDNGAATHEVWGVIGTEIRREDKALLRLDDMDLACDVIADGYEHVRWRRGLSGAQYARSAISGGKYMRLMPGKSVPGHGHRKLEVTVVLEGQLSDGIGGVYQKGDIAFGIPGQRHKPAAVGDAPCICFVAKS